MYYVGSAVNVDGKMLSGPRRTNQSVKAYEYVWLVKRHPTSPSVRVKHKQRQHLDHHRRFTRLRWGLLNVERVSSSTRGNRMVLSQTVPLGTGPDGRMTRLRGCSAHTSAETCLP